MRWAGWAGELEKFEGSMKIWAKLSRWGKVDWVPGSSYYTNMKLTNEDFDIKENRFNTTGVAAVAGGIPFSRS